MPRELIRFSPPGEAPEGWTVIRWFVSVGAVVRKGDSLAEIEGDKAVAEVTATAEGVVLEILAEVGVPLGPDSVLAVLGDPDDRPTIAAASEGPKGAGVEPIAMRVRADCPECGARLAINGPYESIHCHECGTENALSRTDWAAILGVAARGASFGRLLRDPWTLVVRTAQERPACHNCREPLVVTTHDGTVPCPACGLPHREQPPPEWTRKVLWVSAVLGAVEPSMRRAPDPPTCTECGARPLVLGNSPPVLRCPRCSADIRTSPAPSPVPRVWYLLR
jgi:pyruvate/2-oxoglutarate dehydrogenase complex dihydrolipoamide acyltransferase (E2) component